MASKEHVYRVEVEWTGNLGKGTPDYAGYSRDHVISAGAKPPIEGSADPAFRGDGKRWNPEELLLAALSTCHKLWYLHLCAVAGVSVVRYRDAAEGRMEEDASGAGRFVAVMLRPQVEISAGSDAGRAEALHAEAHHYCFIANSVRFPVTCEPTVVVAAGA